MSSTKLGSSLMYYRPSKTSFSYKGATRIGSKHCPTSVHTHFGHDVSMLHVRCRELDEEICAASLHQLSGIESEQVHSQEMCGKYSQTQPGKNLGGKRWIEELSRNVVVLASSTNLMGRALESPGMTHPLGTMPNRRRQRSPSWDADFSCSKSPMAWISDSRVLLRLGVALHLPIYH